ncbi:MAG: hypothetical protein ACAH95_03395 [Fimbriimonas sp.]
MSAVALPPTPRTSGARPPFLPPIHTAFDPGEEGNREPYYKLIAESVRQLMKAIKGADLESLPLLRQLIDQRKKLIESELSLERMMQPEQPLPPLLMNMYALEFLGVEDEPIRTYTRLLDNLDEAARKIDRMLYELNDDSPASLN